MTYIEKYKKLYHVIKGQFYYFLHDIALINFVVCEHKSTIVLFMYIRVNKNHSFSFAVPLPMPKTITSCINRSMSENYYVGILEHKIQPVFTKQWAFIPSPGQKTNLKGRHPDGHMGCWGDSLSATMMAIIRAPHLMSSHSCKSMEQATSRPNRIK